MKRQKTKQKNYRLSEGAIQLLKETASKSGLTDTQVVEACLSLYAVRVPELATQCRECLMAVVAGELGKANSALPNGPKGIGDTAFVKKAYSKAGQAAQPSSAAAQQESQGDGRGTADGQGRSPAKPQRKYLS